MLLILPAEFIPTGHCWWSKKNNSSQSASIPSRNHLLAFCHSTHGL